MNRKQYYMLRWLIRINKNLTMIDFTQIIDEFVKVCNIIPYEKNSIERSTILHHNFYQRRYKSSRTFTDRFNKSKYMFNVVFHELDKRKVSADE